MNDHNEDLLAKVREADRKRACRSGNPYHEISRLKRELASSDYKLDQANERLKRLVPLAAELKMWYILANEAPAIKVHLDELRVMAKLIEPDFFELLEDVTYSEKADYMQRLMFPFLKDPLDDQD